MYDVIYQHTINDLVWSFYEDNIKSYQVIQITVKVISVDTTEIIYHLLSTTEDNHVILRYDYETFSTKQEALNYVGGEYFNITPSPTLTPTPTATQTSG